MDAMRLALRFFATAQRNGARIRPFMEVERLLVHDGLVTGALLHDLVSDTRGEVSADIVVNAAGPWSERVAALAGVDVPINPSPGVLLALRGRFCNMVVNRMHKSADGDIVVPRRNLSVVRTSSWVVEDPDDLAVPEDHVERMYTEGAKLIPAIRDATRRAAWCGGAPADRLARRRHRPRAVPDLQDVRPPRARRRGRLRDDHRRQGHDAARHRPRCAPT